MLKHLVKHTVPTGSRKRLKREMYRLGRMTASLRVLPDFLILGAQKAGTSSLFSYLQDHPQVVMPLNIRKECHFFDHDDHYRLGLAWYRGFFPLRSSVERRRRSQGVALVGEATPEYLFHPLATVRVAETLPRVRLIALVRDPVDRAFSQYRMEVKRTLERRSFAQAIAEERERLARVYPDGQIGTGWPLDADRFDTEALWYQRRGLYLEQLKRWSGAFSNKQLLVIEAERLFSDPRPVWAQVLEFLGLDPWLPPSFDSVNPGDRQALEPSVRADLEAFFAPHNAALAAFLGRPIFGETAAVEA